jgi:ATP-binding cassette subfamily F protein uup
MARLQTRIRELQRRLATRQAELSEAEQRWLELEILREELEGN